MINKYIKFAVPLLLLLFSGLLLSCDNDLEESQSAVSGKGNVSFCIPAFEDSDSDTRTILPASADTTRLYFTLTGARGDDTEATIYTSGKLPVEHMSYTVLSNSGFLLDAGIDWHFTIVGSQKNDDETFTDLIDGSVSGVKIESGTSNKIEFEMTPVPGGLGSIVLTLNCELGTDTESKVSAVTASLAPIENGVVSTDSEKIIVNSWPPVQETDSVFKVVEDSTTKITTITYTKSGVEAGNYFLSLTVSSYCEEAGKTCKSYRNDAVIVTSGCESSKVCDITLRQVYPIEYDIGEGSWVDDNYNKFYSPYEATALPDASHLTNENGSFIKWKAATTGDAATEISSGQSGVKKYIAVWQGKNIYVGSHGQDKDGYGSSADKPYKTVEKVLSILRLANTPSIAYTINIVGRIEENISIDLTSNKHAEKLIFNGYKDTVYTDTPEIAAVKKYNTDEEKYTGTALYIIKTDDNRVPVDIQNLKITGTVGVVYTQSQLYGGAIYIEEDTAIVTLKDGAVITGGTAQHGAGIALITGTLNLDGGSIENCGNSITDTSAEGAGIYIAWGGGKSTFNFNSGKIINNGSENILKGGGIYSLGKVNISGTDGTRVISGNQAQNGGGIYIASGQGNFTLDDGTIENNIAVNGAGLYTENANTAMAGGSISSNTATGNGGGVYVGSTGAFTMSGGTIGSNTASTSGGGIYATKNFTLTNGTITGNVSVNGGGAYIEAATFTMEGGTVSFNTATKNGAGVYNANAANLNMSSGAISGNIAAENGGGVYNVGTMTMTGDAVIGNDAISDFAAADNKSNIAVNGGGIYNARGTLTIGTTGGVYYNYASGSGGGIFAESNESSITVLTLTEGTIAYNTAASDGGGAYSKTGMIVFSGGTIRNNKAIGDGGSTGLGGGIYADGTVTMSGSAVIGDVSKKNVEDTEKATEDSYSNYARAGGGIYINQNQKLVLETDMEGGLFYNYATWSGGGVFTGTSASVENKLIEKNGNIWANGAGTSGKENINN